MPEIFICYRREDSGYAAYMIRTRLVADFGEDAVFMDIDSIPLGVDFRKYLADGVARCDVVLALIGEQWTGDSGGSPRRIDDPNDFVRIELEAALARGIPVIPVLVGKAQPPRAEQLPESLRDLVFRNAAEVRPGKEAHVHLEALSRGIARHFQGPRPRPAAIADAPEKPQKSGPALGAFAARLVKPLVAGLVVLLLILALASWPFEKLGNPDGAPTETHSTTAGETATAEPQRSETLISDPRAYAGVTTTTNTETSQWHSDYPSNRRVRIVDTGKIYSTYPLTETILRRAGVTSGDEIETIIRMAHQRSWPDRINALDKRMAGGLAPMKDYTAYYAADVVDEGKSFVLLFVPVRGNEHMLPGWRPTRDFFIPIGKSGVE